VGVLGRRRENDQIGGGENECVLRGKGREGRNGLD